MTFKTNCQLNLDSLSETFQAITSESCPQRFNFHLHTRYSDGQLQPESLIQQAIDRELYSLAITDHHSLAGYWLAQTYLNKQPVPAMHPLPRLWTGIEITALLLKVQVHILGYGFDPDHPLLSPYTQGDAPQGDLSEGQRVIATLKAAGAITVLAHPARYRLPATEVVAAAVECGIDGIETYYCYDNSNPWRPSPAQSAQLSHLAATYG
ncbi:MAG: PHP domain-containing protein, partial [Acaryochloridaceae cyanobacterium SU_2_1]|nr:PHP domain-containing protein [Acaryochloridaceae cyanobacterium SU_2_1]